MFVLDEIDKLGADYRGDPSSALLEVLDPEQNDTFQDHYLDVSFDLSSVLFIATANVPDTIPGPLRDRMEVLRIAGYTHQEKMQIARRYLWPECMKDHGLTDEMVTMGDPAMNMIIESYTREAGVRSLKRELAAVCRWRQGDRLRDARERHGHARARSRDPRPDPLLQGSCGTDEPARRGNRPGVDLCGR